MRQSSSWGTRGGRDSTLAASAHASTITSEIAYAGQTLTARKNAAVGGVDTTWLVVALPQTANPADVKLMIESGASVLEDAAVGFYFSVDTQIAETNELAFDGYWYKLGKIYPTPFQGLTILKYATGVRGQALS